MADARRFAFASRLLALLLTLSLAGVVRAQDDSDDASADTPVHGVAAQYPVYVPDTPSPAIHGQRIIGFSPNRPFQYRIFATGKEPMTFAASRLPAGLTMDAHTGILAGKVTAPGTSNVTVAPRYRGRSGRRRSKGSSAVLASSRCRRQ